MEISVSRTTAMYSSAGAAPPSAAVEFGMRYLLNRTEREREREQHELSSTGYFTKLPHSS